MSTTVNQHQQSALTTPVNNTSPIDANQVTGNDNAIAGTYNAHDSDPGIHIQSSVLASRPAAGTAGRIWFTSDGLTFSYDNGSSWVAAAIASLSAANITHGTFGSATSDVNPYTFAASVVVTAQMQAGQVKLSGGNTIGNATLGADSNYGLAVQGSPGITYDFTLFKAGGSLNPIMTVPTGTVNVVFAGALTTTGAMSGASITFGGTSSVSVSGSNGLFLEATTGSVNDFSLFSPGFGTNILRVPTGTANVALGGSITTAGLVNAVVPTNSQFFQGGGTFTGYTYGIVTNGTGAFLFGVENSAGGGLCAGDVANDVVIRSQTGISFGYNNGTLGFRLGTNGSTTFAGAITAGAGVTATTGTFSDNITVSKSGGSISTTFSVTAAALQGNNGTGSWAVGTDGTNVYFGATNTAYNTTINAGNVVAVTFNKTTQAATFAAGVSIAGTLGVTGFSTVAGITANNGIVIQGGDGAAAGQALRIGSTTLTTTSQYGIVCVPSANSAATVNANAIYARVNTAASAFTCTSGYGVQIDTPSIGAASAITTLYGLKVENQSGGGTNYAIYTGNGGVHIGDVADFSGGSSTTVGLQMNAGLIKVFGNTTGAGTVLGFGTNCPATTLTAPFTWIKLLAADGSIVYVPAYK